MKNLYITLAIFLFLPFKILFADTYNFVSGDYDVSVYVAGDNHNPENLNYLRHVVFPEVVGRIGTFDHTRTHGCGNTYTFTIGYYVNGSCGTANNVDVATKPTTNLCSQGTPSEVSGSGPWSWSCIGSSQGTTASCSAQVIKYSPIGYHDSSSCSVSTGWACDQSNFSEHILVDFWEGNNPNNLNYIGQTVANLNSEVAVNNACGGTTAHRFEFSTPSELKNGQVRTIYAFGINTGTGNNILLTDSPRSINCSPDPINGECNDTTTSQSYLSAPAESARCTSGIQSNLRNPSYVGGSYKWDCLQQYNGVSELNCTTKPLNPIPGQCGSADGKYYPAQVNITNKCANGTTPTAIISNRNGTFSWDCQGLYYPTVAARIPHDDECNTVTNTGDQLTCRFEPFDQLDNIALGGNLSVKTYVDPTLDITGLKYKFTKDGLEFTPSNGLIRVAGGANYNDIWKTTSFINLKLINHGVYQTKAYLQYFGVDNFASDMCEGNVGDYFVSISLPEISFSIEPELADDQNKCHAKVSVSNNAGEADVQCAIITDTDEVVDDENDLVNGLNDDDREVVAGTLYKLKCELADPLYAALGNEAIDELLETPLDRCVVNPDFRQN